MNEVIAKLYEIEENAGNIMKNAQHYKEDLRQQMLAGQKSFEAELAAELKVRLARTKEGMEAEAQAKIMELEENHRRQMEKLEEQCDRHLEELAEEIFQKIIEV